MLSALSLVNNKVQEFDSKNGELLESLEKARNERDANQKTLALTNHLRVSQKEQLRFIDWFQRWAVVMDAQLQFHAESAKKLRELEQVRAARKRNWKKELTTNGNTVGVARSCWW